MDKIEELVPKPYPTKIKEAQLNAICSKAKWVCVLQHKSFYIELRLFPDLDLEDWSKRNRL